MSKGRNVLNPEYAQTLATTLAKSVPEGNDHIEEWLDTIFRVWVIENAPARRVMLFEQFHHVVEVAEILFNVVRKPDGNERVKDRFCLVPTEKAPEWLKRSLSMHEKVFAIKPLSGTECKVISNLEVVTHVPTSLGQLLKAKLTSMQEDEKAEGKTRAKRVRRLRGAPDEDGIEVPVVEDLRETSETLLPPEPEEYDSGFQGILDPQKWNLTTFSHFVDFLVTLPKRTIHITVPVLMKQVHAWDKRLYNQKLIEESDKDTAPISCKFLEQYEEGRYRIVKLVTSDSYVREGKLMSNCIASYVNRDCELWSIREKDTPRPIGTIELRKQSGRRTVLRKARLLDSDEIINVPVTESGEGYSLYQAKGFANSQIPLPKEVLDSIYSELKIDVSKSSDYRLHKEDKCETAEYNEEDAVDCQDAFDNPLDD